MCCSSEELASLRINAWRPKCFYLQIEAAKGLRCGSAECERRGLSLSSCKNYVPLSETHTSLQEVFEFE